MTIDSEGGMGGGGPVEDSNRVFGLPMASSVGKALVVANIPRF